MNELMEFCAETYVWTPGMMLEETPWASIVDLLEARADRMRRYAPTSEAAVLSPVGEHTWGIGAR